MDKFFLLTYTCICDDGYRHGRHAWFATEEEMKQFIECSQEIEIEVDLAIEVLDHREIDL